MVNTGNTWGTNPVNPWGVVIGDGNTSIGDINGTKALDVAVLASQNSRSESAIYINPGNYTYTTAGNTSTLPRLIGNIRGTGQRPVVSLSSSSTDSLSRKQVYVGSEIRNIKFTSVSTFHVVTLNTGTSNTFRNLVVDNCEFVDAGLQTETFANSTIQSLETRVSVLNTRFSQSGSLTDNLSCYIVGEIDHVLIENSTFIGHGYALRISDSSLTYNQKITLNDVYFDSAGDGTTNMISASSPGTLNYYILISSPFSTVIFDNVKLDAVVDAPTETYPVSAALRSAGTLIRYTDIACKNFTANNCILLFPPQTCVISSVTHGMVGLFVEPTASFIMSDSQVSGGIPLRIGGSASFTDMDASDGETSGAYCCIKNCVISSYPDINGTIVNSCMLDLDMPAYAGNRNDGKPQIVVDGCKIDNYVRGTNYYPAQHTSNTSTNYRGAGGVVIIAKGWSVSFINNLVHTLQPDIDVTGISTLASSLGTFGVFIDTLGDDSGANGSLRSAYVNITNNNIDFNTAGTAGGASYIHACLYFRTAFGVINDNFVNFTSQTATESTPYRIYLGADISTNNAEATNKSSCKVINNIFERYQALSRSMVNFRSGTGQNCIFSDNIFTEDTVKSGSSSPQFIDLTTTQWTKVRNKNQTGVIILNPSYGAVTWYNGQYNISQYNQTELNISNTGLSLGNFSSILNGSLQISQQVSASGIYFNWTIPLCQVLPHGSRISFARMIVNISSAWNAGTFRMQAGGNITTIIPITVSATGAGESAILSWLGGVSSAQTLEVNLENNPYIVIDCGTTLTANSSSIRYATIQLELTYRL